MVVRWGVTIAVLAIALSALAAPEKMIRAGSDRIPGEYLVVLHDDLPVPLQEVVTRLASAHDAAVEVVWSDALKGFFARMTEQRAEAMSQHPFVKYVEENAPWYFSGEHATYVDPAVCDPTTRACPGILDNRLWHLDRADQNTAAPTNRYAYQTDGTGVTVYVVDSGVNKWHQEFGGARVTAGYNSSGDNMPADDPCLGFALIPGTADAERSNYIRQIFYASHGTGVASMAAGRRVGVAKAATIVPVKVARCTKYAARSRKSSWPYAQHQTMMRVSASGSMIGLYQAQTSGTTAGSEPSTWPAAVGATVKDGGVIWRVLDTLEVAQTTQMLVNGLNWIVGTDNPYSKSPAIVTLSMYRLVHPDNDSSVVVGGSNTLEAAVRALLAQGITVIASANNQNGNACDTSPGRLSRNNPDVAVRNDVITVGGSMVRNTPWSIDLSDVTPDYYAAHGGGKGTEPAYSSVVGVRDARWICGAGDSSIKCNNSTLTATPNPGDPDYTVYQGYQGGSNGGPCVTLFAPARNLPVAGLKSASSYRDGRLAGQSGDLLDGGHASGTSWSAPIVAGFAARILQTNPSLTPTQVRDVLLANTDAVMDEATLNPHDHLGSLITGTPNNLLRLSDVNIITHPQTMAAAHSGPTTLSVTASGTSAVSYQWYRVNQGFDFLTYHRGAHSATLLAGETGSTFNAPPDSVAQAYWVRISNMWGSADSTIAVVVPGLTPPRNLVATRGTDGAVALTWTPGTGATAQEVQWKVAGHAWQTIATVTNATTTYDHVPSGTMVVYRVRALKAPAAASSNKDVVNLATYEPLTTIRAQHIVELRQATNDLCAALDLAPVFGMSEVALSSLQGSIVRASDLTTLLERINDVRTHAFLMLAPVSFNTPPATGGVMLGAQVLSARAALQ